jgi:chorismate dehydratase
MPAASSSVSEARKTASMLPKCSTSLRDFVGPRPGVREIASHSNRYVASGETAVFDNDDYSLGLGHVGTAPRAARAQPGPQFHGSSPEPPNVSTWEILCQGHASHLFVKIVESMRRLRISAISYLNTAPLMWDFEQGQARELFDISYTLPSACARALAEGAADIGIIPAAAYVEIPGLVVLPDVAIASRRAVRSILLVCRVPIEKVRTVALDTSSMTSVALTKILFEKWLGGGRDYAPTAPNVEEMLADHDAALLIGDPALKVDRSRYHTLDLAQEWIRWTSKPFVFAFWAVRSEALADADPSLDLASIFRDSRDHGLKPSSLTQIAQEWAPRLELGEDEIRRYLTQNIHYDFDAGCLEGLKLFYRYAAEIGALPAPQELHFAPAVREAVR